MFKSHSKIIRLFCTTLVLLTVVILTLTSCAEEKYKIIDDGVLQSPDGTIYRRYNEMVYFCSDITFGEYLGEVRGLRGKTSEGVQKGVYSLNSDGSDDYVRFVEEKKLITIKTDSLSVHFGLFTLKTAASLALGTGIRLLMSA